MEKLLDTKNATVSQCLKACKNYKEEIFLVSKNDRYDIQGKEKFRGIDPLVRRGKSKKRLSEIMHSYKNDYERVKKSVESDRYYQVKMFLNQT